MAYFSSDETNAPETTVECPSCGEINKEGVVACARCGRALLSDEQMKERRAQIEAWKREAERESVEYTTTANLLLDRFTGAGPKKKTFGPISNHRKRIGLACIAAAVIIVVLLGIATGR
jgi:uncharacterized membrane protein YvbJ